MMRNSISLWLWNRSLAAFFLTGKVIRYIFYFLFIYFLSSKTQGISGYSSNQMLFFLATFAVVDNLSQFLFRNVYSFRQLIVSGDFDLVLSKPLNPLFRSIMGGPDPIDLVMILPLILVTILFGISLDPSLLEIFYYIVLIINGLLISLSFHIAVISLGIITLEVDHTIMIYRDISSMGRFPVDIYKFPLREILTFIVPVGVMATLPAKSLMGLISPLGLVSAIFFGFGILYFSLNFWKFALKKYTSASS